MKANPRGYRRVLWNLQLFLYADDSVLNCDNATALVTTIHSCLPQLITLDHITSFDLAYSFTLCEQQAYGTFRPACRFSHASIVPDNVYNNTILWNLVRISTSLKTITPDKIIDHNVDLWLTDGSGIHDCFGAGVYGPLYNYRESIPMGSLSTVFSAEVMAILRCTEFLLTNNLTRRR